MKSLTGVVATTLRALRLAVVLGAPSEVVVLGVLEGVGVLEPLFGGDDSSFLKCKDPNSVFEERSEVSSGSCMLIPNGTPGAGKPSIGCSRDKMSG